MVFFLRFLLSSEKRSRNRLSDSQITKPCSSPSAVLYFLVSSTLIYSGPGFNEIRARSSTFVVWVAEKSIVCLSSSGSILTIWRISSSKPTSRILSASSITSAFIFLNIKPFVFCKWSSRRPGVAISKLTPLESFSASALLLAPPMTTPYVCEWWAISSRATPKICRANSRVGEIIMTPVPAAY